LFIFETEATIFLLFAFEVWSWCGHSWWSLSRILATIVSLLWAQLCWQQGL